MSTVRRRIVDGKIINEVGEPVDYEIVHGNWNNPWVVQIKDGQIFCHCEAIYSDGKREMDKSFPLEDGTLGLSGGRIDDRYAYFRTKVFQDFLEENRFQSINPKFMGIWSGKLKHANCSKGTASYCIFTDGKLEHISSENAPWVAKNNITPFSSIFDSIESFEIKDAKWAVVGTSVHYKHQHNLSIVLHVQKSVTLSEMTFPEEMKSYLKGFNSLSEPKTMDQMDVVHC